MGNKYSSLECDQIRNLLLSAQPNFPREDVSVLFGFTRSICDLTLVINSYYYFVRHESYQLAALDQVSVGI